MTPKPKPKKILCFICTSSGNGDFTAIGEYFLPKEKSGLPDVNGWLPVCEYCLQSVIAGGFETRLTDKKYIKLHGGPYNHDWHKMTIYPGPKGVEWRCAKCKVKHFGTFPGQDKGCHVPGGRTIT